MLSLEQSLERLRTTSVRRLQDTPPAGYVVYVLERPFCEKPFNSYVRSADESLYTVLEAPRLRLGVILDALIQTDIEIDFGSSKYTTYDDDEKLKEEIDGIDSTLALAVTVNGVASWLSIVHYHLYIGGEEKPEVYKYRGSKRLGPSAYITRRSLHGIGSDFLDIFPHDDARYSWYGLDDQLFPYPQDIIGVNLDEIAVSKSNMA